MRDATARLNIWHGPVRSSKTIHSLIAWIEFTQTAPTNGLLMMIGRTEEVLERNVLLPLAEMLKDQFWYSRGQHRARIGRRTLHLLGEADARAEEKVRGGTWAGFYRDEMSLGSPEFHRQCMARLSVAGARGFGTTNPGPPYHWLKTEWIDRAHELDVRAFHWPIEVNVHLPPAYIENLKREYGPGTLWYKRFIQGLWVQAEGAVFDFFDEAIHTLEPPDPAEFEEFWVSADYGTGNPTVFILVGVRRPAPSEPMAVALAEYYHSGRESGSRTDLEYATDLTAWLEGLGAVGLPQQPSGGVVTTPRLAGRPVRGIILDPSAASFKTQLRRLGWSVRPADNEVLAGIRTHARMLKAGEFAVSRACTRLIRSYGGYLWDAQAQERGEDKPLKQNDHEQDAIRYALHTLFARVRPQVANKPRGW
ncbi:phage terminase large subunit [Meiothermus granaticius NBRC 107808]|nr:phage terminase large subunit [Meiothermus granaticius NBRC 107808]